VCVSASLRQTRVTRRVAFPKPAPHAGTKGTVRHRGRRAREEGIVRTRVRCCAVLLWYVRLRVRRLASSVTVPKGWPARATDRITDGRKDADRNTPKGPTPLLRPQRLRMLTIEANGAVGRGSGKDKPTFPPVCGRCAPWALLGYPGVVRRAAACLALSSLPTESTEQSRHTHRQRTGRGTTGRGGATARARKG